MPCRYYLQVAYFSSPAAAAAAAQPTCARRPPPSLHTTACETFSYLVSLFLSGGRSGLSGVCSHRCWTVVPLQFKLESFFFLFFQLHCSHAGASQQTRTDLFRTFAVPSHVGFNGCLALAAPLPAADFPSPCSVSDSGAVRRRIARRELIALKNLVKMPTHETFGSIVPEVKSCPRSTILLSGGSC